ncbi:hypothetical protein GCM10020256_32780 [Streptomyces thermocoprophilus]
MWARFGYRLLIDDGDQYGRQSEDHASVGILALAVVPTIIATATVVYARVLFGRHAGAGRRRNRSVPARPGRRGAGPRGPGERPGRADDGSHGQRHRPGPRGPVCCRAGGRGVAQARIVAVFV